MDGGPQSIDELTRQFCQRVIDNTTESLRSSYSAELGEDQLDKLKSRWEQCWKKNLHRQEEEAKEKQNQRLMNMTQHNEQQNAIDVQSIQMQQNHQMQPYYQHMNQDRMGPPGRHMPMQGHQPYYPGQHPPAMAGQHPHRGGAYPVNQLLWPGQMQQHPHYQPGQTGAPPTSSNKPPAVLGPPRQPSMGPGGYPQHRMQGPPHGYQGASNLSMTGSAMGGPPGASPGGAQLQHQPSLISHSSLSMNRPVYKTNSIMRGSGDQQNPGSSYPVGGPSYPPVQASLMSRNESIDVIGNSFSRASGQYGGGPQSRPAIAPPYYGGDQGSAQSYPPGNNGSSGHGGNNTANNGGQRRPGESGSNYPSTMLGRRTYGQAHPNMPQDGQAQHAADGVDGGSEQDGSRRPATLGFVPPTSTKRARNNDGSSDDEDDDDDDLFDRVESKTTQEKAVSKEPSSAQPTDQKESAQEEQVVLEPLRGDQQDQEVLVTTTYPAEDDASRVTQEIPIKESQSEAQASNNEVAGNLAAESLPTDQQPNSSEQITQVAHQQHPEEELKVENSPPSQRGPVAHDQSNAEQHLLPETTDVQPSAPETTIDHQAPTAYANQFPNVNSNDELSSDPDSEKTDDKDDNVIYAEYVRVNRTRVRFKCDFRNAFININGKEYVAKNLTGDFGY